MTLIHIMYVIHSMALFESLVCLKGGKAFNDFKAMTQVEIRHERLKRRCQDGFVVK